MSVTPERMLEALGSRGWRVMPGAAPGVGEGSGSFESLLRAASVAGSDRGRVLDPDRVLGESGVSGVERLGELVDRAAASGVTRAVAILPEGAVVIDVQERVIRRALDASEGVVTGIDGVLRPVESPSSEVPYPPAWSGAGSFQGD